MRKFILILLVSVSISAQAQFNVAFIGGAQMNSVSPALTQHPDTVTNTFTKRTGLNFGLMGNVALNKKQTLFFRTGVLYSAKGSEVLQTFDTSKNKYVQDTAFLRATTNLKVNYIDMPVDFMLKLPIKGKTKFLLGVGAQASLFYNGSTDFNTIEISTVHKDSVLRYIYTQKRNEDLPVGKVDNKYRVVHFSGHGVAGFEFGRTFLTVSYSRGLTPFYVSGDKEFKHSTISFNFGVFFGTLGNKQADK